ncbi:hypothetical protein ACT3SP_16000 [Brachybacterium sp. AOP43-C2-M15]|uniref:hypothetical protein n=1 Tax=Brachybacterium sp. AOP43-C2-M15 TaxID=3457661 RepID=UPI0040341F02
MKAAEWKRRPDGTLRASIGILVWLLSTIVAAALASSYAFDGTSQLCGVVLGFLVLCLLSVGVFRGPKEQEASWLVRACMEAMRWQLLVASIVGAIGLTAVVERHSEPVREALGDNFGLAWIVLIFAASGAGAGRVLTRSYAVAVEAREEREAREAMARAVALAVRDSDDEWSDVMAKAIGREVAEAIRHGQPAKVSLWARIFGR